MKLYRQVILLTLTLLVLVSSTGMAVGMHICGGELRDVTLFGTAADCPMEKQQEDLPPCHAAEKEADDNCCEDHKVVVERTDATSEHDAITLSKTLDIKFIAAVQTIILQLFAPEAAIQPTYARYASPPLARDIPVLVQSFLL
ncbi:hypothetical protein DXT99_05725 [Pontibacter diazotrophicus]|uniref:Secreted protein n=1 Tax=Pontibacter diazotrophicus TaxID=1400979 RepID=A0A3D8LFK4_9BACT|nr:hypothetical protein [Pontibacter diazotrophicus]RDV16168.1 hypothetical protein DXT99_05725 [Pontibacter diazotrophicus]